MSMFDMMPFERRNSMARFDPFRELENFEKSFFGDFGGGFRTTLRQGRPLRAGGRPARVKKEDIAVDIDGDCLTISAQRDSQREEKNEQEQYVRRERSYGSYRRSFDISNVKSEEISGSYENGVLKLVLPKRSPTGSASRRLDIQ